MQQQLAAAKARITELERQRREAAEAKPASGLARARGGFHQPLNEVTKLRGENASLRARIKILTPTLDGEVIKLRREIELMRGERASLKLALKRAARERDGLQHMVDRATSPEWRKLRMAGRLNVEVFN